MPNEQLLSINELAQELEKKIIAIIHPIESTQYLLLEDHLIALIKECFVYNNIFNSTKQKIKDNAAKIEVLTLNFIKDAQKGILEKVKIYEILTSILPSEQEAIDEILTYSKSMDLSAKSEKILLDLQKISASLTDLQTKTNDIEIIQFIRDAKISLEMHEKILHAVVKLNRIKENTNLTYEILTITKDFINQKYQELKANDRLNNFLLNEDMGLNMHKIVAFNDGLVGQQYQELKANDLLNDFLGVE
jgi:hypothetical protein